MHFADCNALAARLGWLPSYPSFNRNPLEITKSAAAEIPTAEYVVRELKADRLQFAAEDPDAPENFPRVLTIWRANLLGSSSKGHEYFLKHLLGVTTSTVKDRRGNSARAAPTRSKMARRGAQESSIYWSRSTSV